MDPCAIYKNDGGIMVVNLRRAEKGKNGCELHGEGCTNASRR